VLAGAGGQIKNLTETNVALGTAASGASVVREIDGLRLFISALEGFEDSTLAAQIPVEPASSSTLSAATATDFFTATVIPPT
jgi:hypothetical protein